jgi:uncharacterized protein YegL
MINIERVPAPWVDPIGRFGNGGPQASIAWDGSGARLVLGSDAGRAEFLVLEVAAGGKVEAAAALAACPDADNSPNDIITANGFVTPPATPTIVASTTPTVPTRTPTVVVTRTVVRSSTTPTATPFKTATPTAVPLPIYLPITLRERCNPQYYRSDIALVLDTSSSMTGQKIADARSAALLFVGMIDLAPGRSQVAVVRYDREAEVVRELTRARTTIEAAIRSLHVRSGTHIDKGLRAALGELQSPRHLDRNLPVMILLTDGLQTGTPGEELRAAAEVRDAGIRLYTIGLGADVDEAVLKAMAGDGDRYYHAPDSADLARIYAEIAVDLMCPGTWGGR